MLEGKQFAVLRESSKKRWIGLIDAKLLHLIKQSWGNIEILQKREFCLARKLHPGLYYRKKNIVFDIP